MKNRVDVYQKILKFLSVLLAFAILFLVWTNRVQLVDLYGKIDLYWVGTGLICYLANYFFRSLRLQRLSENKLCFFTQAFKMSALHGFFSYLLPLRAGDASLPLLLKSTSKIGLKQGTLFLIKTRFLDLSMLGIFTLAGSLVGARMISSQVQMIWFFTGILLALSFFIMQRLGYIGNYLVKKKLNSSLDILSILKFDSKEFLFTFLIWVFMYATQLCVVRSMGLDLGFSEVIFISAIQFPLQMLPVQGLANTGNHEGGWVTAMMLMGFSSDTGLEFALVSHGILIFYVVVLGGAALFTGIKGQR
ncbi:MAG: flippase-like domain-containing protein [Desulfobacter sp.]|nr:flippase-like domain-containing protein [Desulfobacter sp.]WDP86602.1 MAG: flippase-like domain-containing protein [Desulfobacter sp.]